MNAPNLVMFTTSPSYSAPRSGSGGKAIIFTRSTAAASASASLEAMRTIPIGPCSSISMVAPVSSSSSRMTLPFGPMTSPILSLGISTA